LIRRGFTIIELLVVMILLTLVGGAIVTVLLRQQRFYNSTQTLLETRQSLRQAVAMLPGDLRAISSVGGDIYAMTDSSIEFRSTFGTAILCATPSTTQLNIVPLNLGTSASMSTWFTAPVVNDSIAVYDPGANPLSSTDDFWRMYGITAITPLAGSTVNCNNTTGLIQATDAVSANTVYQYTISPARTATIGVGAPMRFFKKVHYSLWRNATDGLWYLEWYDCRAGRTPICALPQPVAGPFNAYSAGSTSGLAFSYFDSTGAVTANRLLVSRISIVVRGQSSSLVNFAGAGAKVFADSIRMEVGLRNRK
jgi:prepilin-type N-terminal cleavage/methylation domain-containing protein